MADLRALAESLRIRHLNVEDCWYSCPKSEDGCCNCWYSCPKSEDGCCNDNYADGECICGADDHNARVDALLLLIDGSESG